MIEGHRLALLARMSWAAALWGALPDAPSAALLWVAGRPATQPLGLHLLVQAQVRLKLYSCLQACGTSLLAQDVSCRVMLCNAMC